MAEYGYDAAGKKLSVTYTTSKTNLMVPMGSIVPPQATNVAMTLKTDYCGNMIYENGKLSKILTDVGYFTLNSGGEPPLYHYFLQDHLGNNRVVVQEDGKVEQVNHYYAFGGLMGESSGGEVQPYKYNAKELNRMHGLDWYDYGARMYDPVIGRWTAVDPLAEKYYSMSPYGYCLDDPVNAIDPDGRKVVFINGKIGGGSPVAGSQYWNGTNSTFVQKAEKFFNDINVSFTNRDYGYLSSASQRRKEGYEYAKSVYHNWISSMQPDESFKLVSHSMGGAFSMGIEDYIKEQGRSVDYNVMINTYQVDKINVDKSSKTFYIDYQNTNDPVLFWFDSNLGRGKLENSNMRIREKSSEDMYHIHRSPIDTGDFWKTIKDNMEK